MDVNRIFDRLRHPAADTVADGPVAERDFRPLLDSRYCVLLTYRRSGKAVATPVWFAEAGGRLYVRSEGETGKVKRIRAGSDARVAPCTFRGRPTGPPIAARARLAAGDKQQLAEDALAQKYGLLRRLYRRAFPPGEGSVYIELSPLRRTAVGASAVPRAAERARQVTHEESRSAQEIGFPFALMGVLTLLAAVAHGIGGSSGPARYWMIAAPVGVLYLAWRAKRREESQWATLVVIALLAVTFGAGAAFGSITAADFTLGCTLAALGAAPRTRILAATGTGMALSTLALAAIDAAAGWTAFSTALWLLASALGLWGRRGFDPRVHVARGGSPARP